MKKELGRTIKKVLGNSLRYFIKVKSDKYLFIPYSGTYETKMGSLENFRSDNVLIFLRYLLDNKNCSGKEFVIVVNRQEDLRKERNFCKVHYPDVNIRFISNYSSPYWRNGIRFQKEATSSKLIISAEDRLEESFGIPYKRNSQKFICLGYYPVSLKDGYLARKGLGNSIKMIDIICASSLIDIQIECTALTADKSKFLPIGKCKTDILYEYQDVQFVREYFQKKCSYFFDKIVLYVPTHRDYERGDFDITRSILGFEVSQNTFEKYLKDRKLIIVCKLHPGQNASIISEKMPNGIFRFDGDEHFGLTELMKASDMLITDYTSAYVDYLLLDKPVLFNFYDLEQYSELRGLAFEPYERICAGLQFTDEQSFYKAMDETLANPDLFKKERADMLEYLQTYRTNVREKTYSAIFGENGIIHKK